MTALAPTGQRYFKVREVAGILGCSRWTVWRLIDAGELLAIRSGDGYRIETVELEETLERLKNKALREQEARKKKLEGKRQEQGRVGDLGNAARMGRRRKRLKRRQPSGAHAKEDQWLPVRSG